MGAAKHQLKWCTVDKWPGGINRFLLGLRVLGEFLYDALVRGRSCFATFSPVFSPGQSQASHLENTQHYIAAPLAVTLISDGTWNLFPSKQCSEVEVSSHPPNVFLRNERY